jgi:hypothetical protein
MIIFCINVLFAQFQIVFHANKEIQIYVNYANQIIIGQGPAMVDVCSLMILLVILLAKVVMEVELINALLATKKPEFSQFLLVNVKAMTI